MKKQKETRKKKEESKDRNYGKRGRKRSEMRRKVEKNLLAPLYNMYNTAGPIDLLGECKIFSVIFLHIYCKISNVDQSHDIFHTCVL